MGGLPPMAADREAEMQAKLRAVRPSPTSGYQIEAILQEYGRPTALDQT